MSFASEIGSKALNKVFGGNNNQPGEGGFNVQNMVSSINKSGIAKTSHFEVQITPPNEVLGMMNNYIKDLSFRIDSVEIPGRAIETKAHSPINYGPTNVFATGMGAYNPVTVTFYLSEDMREREFFEIWQNNMVNTGTFEQQTQNTTDYSLSKFNTRYYNDYVGRIIIRQFGSAGNLQSLYTLEQAVPKTIGGIQMNWADDGVAKMSVSFNYHYYKAVFAKQNQPDLGVGFSLRIGKGGLQGSLRLPGIGTIAGGGGFGTTANLNPLKKKIFSAIGLD